jgi:hypothetical protein
VDQQGDHGHGADDPGGLEEAAAGVLVEDAVAHEAADERADDAQHDRGEDRDVLLARAG